MIHWGAVDQLADERRVAKGELPAREEKEQASCSGWEAFLAYYL